MDTPAERLQRLVGDRIRALREAARLTQRDLARKARINPKYLGEAERAQTNVTLDMLAKIADGLDVSVEELVRPPDAVARSGIRDAARLAVLLEKLDEEQLGHIFGVAEQFTRYRPRSRKRPPRR